MRINNAALIGAILFTVSLSLIYKKQFKNLFLNAVAFLLGFVVSFTPMLAFYAYHGILQEMLSQVFLFGVCYSSEIGFAEKLYNLITINFSYILIMLLPVVVLFVFRVKSRRYWLLSFSAFALTLVACAMGNGYVHYFALIIPNIILAAALLFRFMPQKTVFSMLKTKRKKIIAVSLSMILLAIGCVQPCKQSVDWVVNNLSRIAVANFVSERPRFRYVREIKSYIPEDDYDSVYAYDIRCSSWYAQTGIFPANKYCDWQAHYIELQPEIGDELAKWISEKSVKWIVLPADKEVEPPQIAQAIKENYSVYAENEAYILMRSNG